MKLRISAAYWLFPILYFFMVWFTLNDVTKGTDFAAQLYMLELVQDQQSAYFVDPVEPMLCYYVYGVLYSVTGMSPRLYVAILSFLYFALIFYSCKTEANRIEYPYLSQKSLGRIVLYACLCFCPIFICIVRYHFATILVVTGVLLLYYSRKKLLKFAGIVMMLLAFRTHEGVVILYGIILLGWLLETFWLSKVRNNNVRNKTISFVALGLFFAGPLLFPLVSGWGASHGMLNERYADDYAQQQAGDGAYLLVLVLSLFGSMLSLYITSLFDKKNNWITAICISGLFMMCFLFNQKFFYVQRVFMFMPVFMGLSCVQVIGSLPPGEKKNTYVFFLLSVPIIYLCQLIIQKNYFFWYI